LLPISAGIEVLVLKERMLPLKGDNNVFSDLENETVTWSSGTPK
jgi:hypothetical protein